MGKLKEKFKEKMVQAQLGLNMAKMYLDVKKEMNKAVLFPDMPQESTNKWGILTLHHFGTLIIIMLFFIAGFWWKPSWLLGFIVYVAYNVAEYRRLDTKND